MATIYTIGHGARHPQFAKEIVHLLASGHVREHAVDPQEELWRDD